MRKLVRNMFRVGYLKKIQQYCKYLIIINQYMKGSGEKRNSITSQIVKDEQCKQMRN